ncbi:zf-HC2 domain-containing protein [candidate division WOR-3 bacterium]|nr:zf-HC2 domain-containing protein [candidate division WOR-3 bacterium]
MSRDCRRVEGLLGRFVDGELDEQQAEWVGRHIDSCPGCRQKLAEFEAVDRLFREKDEPPRLAEEYWDWHRSQVWRAIRTVRRRQREGARTLRFTWMRAASVAAGAAVVLIAAIGGWRLLQRQVAVPVTVAEEPVERGAGEARVTSGGGRQAIAAGEPVAESKSADLSRQEHRSDKPAAGLARSADELKVETEVMADADGLPEAGAAADRQSTVETREKVAGRIAARGQAGTGEAEVFTAVQAPTAPGQAGVDSGLKKEGEQPAEVLTTCDRAPEVLEIGILPRVSPDETVTVFLRVLVEPDGSVSQVELEQASGTELLDSLAVLNVRQARFRAGYLGSEPARCWVRLVQQFDAEEPADSEQDNQ